MIRTATTLALLLLASPASATERPNVVLIVLDDLNHYGLSCYGARSVESTEGAFPDTPLRTPRIDSLAEGGVRCDQAFVYAICEPTRVAMLTGMHNGRNFTYPKAIHESQITISDVFKRAGYATGMYGKWKQTRGTPEAPGETYISRFGWDDYCCFDVIGEGSRYLEPNLVVNGRVVNYAKRGGVDPQTSRRWYGPDICNRAALRFIDDHRDEPFFLYYPLILVHDQHTPTPDTTPPSVFDGYDMSVKGRHGHRPGDDRQFYPDMLAYMDKMVGTVIDKLDEHGLREDTLIVVMGDNGAKVCFRFTLEDGRRLIGRKGHSRDGGEHVGLIFNRPGTAPPGVYGGLFDVVDIYPTLLAACGIEAPNAQRIDGVSAWPQIVGAIDEPHRRSFYKWYNRNNPMTDESILVTYAQTTRFKRYAPHTVFPNGRFFDVENDRDEEAGERVSHVIYDDYHHSGLDLEALTPEQQEAYDELGEVLEANRYRPVEAAQIVGSDEPLGVGEHRSLSYELTPENATRNNAIWTTSNPAVASISKFGELTAHTPGQVEVRLYSWDDTMPVAAGPDREAFDRSKVRDKLRLTVR